MKKILITLLLLVVFATPVFAAIDLGIEVDTTGNVTINGSSDYRKTPVSIKVFDAKRHYYIDQTTTDDNGDFEFSFGLDVNNEYSGKINISGEYKEFSISTTADEPAAEPQETVSLYIRGYKGVVLPRTAVEIQEGDTVLDVLIKVLDENGIAYEIRDGYVASIADQREFDRGSGSGWMYRINGVFPDVGAGMVKVKDGDRIEFLYTEDLGEDLGRRYDPDLDLGDIADIGDQARKVVEDEDASEEEVAEAVDHVTDSISDAAKNIKTEDDADDLVDIVGRTVEVIEKAANRVKLEDASQKVAIGGAKLVEALAEVADRITDEKAGQNIRDIASRVMDSVLKVMGRITDETELGDVTDVLIKSAGRICKKLSRKDVAAVHSKVAKIAQKFIEAVGTDRISKNEVEAEAGRIKARLNPQRLAEKAARVEEKIKEINSKLEDNEIQSNKTLEKKLSVEMPPVKELNEVEINLPGEVMDIAKMNKISKIEIKTDIADFSISANTFGESVKGKDVSLNARKVAKEQLSGSAQKELPDNTTIVDLNVTIEGKNVDKFNEPMEVSLVYNLKEDDDPESITVFLLKDDGTVEPVGGKYDINTGKVRFWTNHFSMYFARPAIKEFVDLSNFRWAEKPIQLLAGKGIINGRTQTQFDPDADITRAEFTALLARMLKLDGKQIKLTFTDVMENAWYAEEIAAAYSHGVVKGKDEKRFEPKGKITRQEMAVMIARVLEKHGYKPANDEELEIFNDKDRIAVWAKKGVAIAAREKIIRGMENGSFVPAANATRAQAAVMLYRLYQLLL